MGTALRAEDVIALVDERWGTPCAGCELPLVGQEVVLGLLMGFGDTLRCAWCLAASVGRTRARFLREAVARIRRLDCYRAGWTHADRRLGVLPPERWPRDLRIADEPDAGRVAAPVETPIAAPEGADAAELERGAHERFDAGDMSCGDLVLVLRREMTRLPQGALLRVVARDLAAPQDLPAWCGLTGHVLRAARHPVYWIERRPD